METLESDLKRLVQNAKDFNSNKSEVYEDAERIRKALSNFMPKHNPAYLDPGYRAYPTPLPGAPASSRTNGTPTPSAEVSGNTENLKIKFPNTLARRRQSMAVPSDEDDGPDDELIAKQVEIIDKMMELPNAEYVTYHLPRFVLTSYRAGTSTTSLQSANTLNTTSKSHIPQL